MSEKLSDTIGRFLLARQAEGVSQQTLKWYAGKLSAFRADVGDRSVEKITADQVRKHLAALRARTAVYPGQARQRAGALSAHTIAGHDRALRTFLNWWVDESDVPGRVSPLRNIRKPKVSDPEPKAATIDDLIMLLAVTGDDPIGLRDRAILMFLIDTGCRAAGLCGLTPESLDLEKRKATVIEKGNRARPVYLLPATCDAIAAWLAVRPPHADTVFCAMHRRREGGKLRREGLYLILSKLASLSGITGHWNPHSFRHAFALLSLDAGNDLATLSELLGHTDLDTTKRYLLWTDKQKADRHDRYSPVNTLLDRLRVE